MKAWKFNFFEVKVKQNYCKNSKNIENSSYGNQYKSVSMYNQEFLNINIVMKKKTEGNLKKIK